MSGPRFPAGFLVLALGLGGLVALLYTTRQSTVLPARAAPSPAENTAGLADGHSGAPQGPGVAPVDDGVDPYTADPAILLGRIGTALAEGDSGTAARLVGEKALSPVVRQRLVTLAESGSLRLHRDQPVLEVGELELRQRVRWALRLDGPATGRDRIFFDLAQQDGRWVVESAAFPPASDGPASLSLLPDSLGVADAFLQAAMQQQFARARELADPATVPDAKIASLCILFGEGGYRLRLEKPVRAMFRKEGLAGYLVRAELADGSNAAEFSLILARSGMTGSWRVSELDLDRLLSGYATRVAGRDSSYTPLVKNPAGGDTLALYFGFEEEELSPGSVRQLQTVARILRSGPGRKLTISSYTGTAGEDDFSRTLAVRRTAAVMRQLVAAGVDSSQIVVLQKGTAQSRRSGLTGGQERGVASGGIGIWLDFQNP